MLIEVIMSLLFWVGLVQWATLTPLALASQRFLIPRMHQFLEILLDLVVFVVVAAIVIFVPLYVTGNLPLPSGHESSFYMYGFVLGALLSVPIRRFVGQVIKPGRLGC